MTPFKSASRISSWLGVVAGSLLPIFVCVFAVLYAARFSESLKRDNSLYEVGDMIVYFLRQNSGEFPRNWEDLEGSFHVVKQGYGGIKLSELKEEIEINFNDFGDETGSRQKSIVRSIFMPGGEVELAVNRRIITEIARIGNAK